MGFLGRFAFVASLIILSGCGEEKPTFGLLPDSQTFIQDKSGINNQVDLLFVIDDQPNMSAFQQKLVTSMATFMNIFITKGFDFKIAVVTTSGFMADPTLNGYNAANVALADFNQESGAVSSGFPVITPSVSNIFSVFAINAKPNKNSAGQDARAFSSMRQGLQSTRPINTGFLRSNGFLAVIIVDNQDDFSGNGRCVGCNVSGRYNAPTLDPVDNYISFLDSETNSTGASARYNVSAMTQIGVPCQGGTNMVRIMDLATRTNGVLGDICQADFGPSMAVMADNIATLSTQFVLDRVPNVSTIVVQVDGVTIPQDAADGWTYSSDANAIFFHGDAIPNQGASISVNFDPITIR